MNTYDGRKQNYGWRFRGNSRQCSREKSLGGATLNGYPLHQLARPASAKIFRLQWERGAITIVAELQQQPARRTEIRHTENCVSFGNQESISISLSIDHVYQHERRACLTEIVTHVNSFPLCLSHNTPSRLWYMSDPLLHHACAKLATCL